MIVRAESGSAWMEGELGWFARLRALAVELAGTVGIATACQYLWKHWYLTVGVAIAGLGLAFGLVVFRRYRLKAVKLGDNLHNLCHRLRDQVSYVLEPLVLMQDDGEEALREYRRRYDGFHSEAANAIANFFKDFVGDQDVRCCIRMARKQNGSSVFCTVGRSEGYDAQRAADSEPIPADSGIARKLRHHGKRGVFWLRNIDTAEEEDAWKRTKNDRLPDIDTQMIAPINGVKEGRPTMMGMLHVTASGDDFKMFHNTPVKAFADILGMIYGVTSWGLPEEEIVHV